MADSFFKKALKLLGIWLGGTLLSAPAALFMLFILDSLPEGSERYSFLGFTLVFALISAGVAYFWIRETRGGKILYAVISAALFIAPRIGLLMFGLA